ncbi:MAG: pilus assembly protein TadG-related protein [Litorimonas sp.]
MTHYRNASFLRDTRGNLSIITGVVGVLLMTAVGASLDGGQMFSTKQRLQSITDAAALMATTPDGITASKRKDLAEASIYSHVEKVGGLNISSTTINVNEAEGQVYVALTADVPMLFGGVLGSDNRRVSASSLAEASSSVSMNSMSISLVLDLSGSMADRFDNRSKLASVNAAMSDMLNSINSEFGSEVASATSISTGVYPFNWGMVDGETVALEPGTNAILDSLAYLSLSNGSLPTTAMEQAVADQLDEMETKKNRDRYIVYVTDGKVDEDKSDVAGQYLTKSDLFASRETKECEQLAKKLLELDKKLEPELVEEGGNKSPLSLNILGVGLNLGGDDDDDDDDEDEDETKKVNGLKSSKHAGHNHGSKKIMEMAKRIELREDYVEVCQPKQPIRVAMACEEAREQNISIIAINLSGEDGIASNTIDSCINGVDTVTSKEFRGRKKREDKFAKKATAQEGNFKTLSSGVKVRVSADGKSYAGDATSLEELRDMLGAMLPDGKKERHVRLVG